MRVRLCDFEKFVGNGSRHDVLSARFDKMEKVKIEERDFYDAPQFLQDQSVDILHIDIANNGDVFEFAVTRLIHKLSSTGVMILEGGSPARDNVPWMTKYGKRPIHPYLQSIMHTDELLVTVVGSLPGMTCVRRRQ